MHVQPYSTWTCRTTDRRTFSSVGDCALTAIDLDEAGILWMVLVSSELRTDALFMAEGALARALIIVVEFMLGLSQLALDFGCFIVRVCLVSVNLIIMRREESFRYKPGRCCRRATWPAV